MSQQHPNLDRARDFVLRNARLFGAASLDEELDMLASQQLEDGGRPIAWDPPSEAAMHEWRGAVTVAALRTLGDWGRL